VSRLWEILATDCVGAMQFVIDPGSVDSIVTDPPYELGFMGKSWDSTGVANSVDTWRAAFAVLKPGGHLLAFSGTRTYHRMACAIEDAGFEIRDQIGWVYGSGFPKSHNGEWGGTALKPAWEPIVMARKPLIGTVEANWKEHGTGALNIDGCRVGDDVRYNAPAANAAGGNSLNMSLVGMPQGVQGRTVTGRWPANIIHDGSDEVLAAFPVASGQSGSVTGDEPSSKTNNVYGAFNGRPATEPRGDSGSAARFFYCAKASKRDRNDGCAGLPLKPSGRVSNTSGQHITRRDGGAPSPTANNHPTVKPTDLMRYLCRLVTPAGGLILDPFMGSGSTGKAAVLEGFRFLGCELSDEYVRIADARIAAAAASLMRAAA
jgi:site-specific DNA-methyltransferase (adenine-specific)